MNAWYLKRNYTIRYQNHRVEGVIFILRTCVYIELVLIMRDAETS